MMGEITVNCSSKTSLPCWNFVLYVLVTLVLVILSIVHLTILQYPGYFFLACMLVLIVLQLLSVFLRLCYLCILYIVLEVVVSICLFSYGVLLSVLLANADTVFAAAAVKGQNLPTVVELPAMPIVGGKRWIITNPSYLCAIVVMCFLGVLVRAGNIVVYGIATHKLKGEANKSEKYKCSTNKDNDGNDA